MLLSQRNVLLVIVSMLQQEFAKLALLFVTNVIFLEQVFAISINAQSGILGILLVFFV